MPSRLPEAADGKAFQKGSDRMKQDTRVDRIAALSGIILSVPYIIYALTNIKKSKLDFDPGPKLFPVMAGGLLLVCSLILLFRKHDEVHVRTLTGEQAGRLFRLIGVFSAYIVLLWLIGYTIPTFLLVFVTCTMFSQGKDVSLAIRLVYAAAVTVAVWLLFHYGLKCILPRGMFTAFNILPL